MITNELFVEVGGYRIANNPTVLKSIGLGSCISIMLYDPVRRIGGMAHAMLPFYEEGRDRQNPIKYVDTSIYIMLDEMVSNGAKKERIVAKLAGGAQMFGFLGSTMNIGERNIKAAKEILKKEKIPLKSEDTGGNQGRTVIMDVVTGDVSVWTVSDNQEVII